MVDVLKTIIITCASKLEKSQILISKLAVRKLKIKVSQIKTK